MKKHGEAPNIHILDNECSNEMKSAFNEAEVKYQLVPPHVHRRNAAERAIRTFKNHLKQVCAYATQDIQQKNGIELYHKRS